MSIVTTARIFRLLRVFKLAKIWKSFQYILITVGNTMKKVATFLMLLYLFIFIYTVLGMQLFAYKIQMDIDGNPVDTHNAELP